MTSILKSAERLVKARGFQVQVFASAEDFQQSAIISDGMCLLVDIHLAVNAGLNCAVNSQFAGSAPSHIHNRR